MTTVMGYTTGINQTFSMTRPSRAELGMYRKYRDREENLKKWNIPRRRWLMVGRTAMVLMRTAKMARLNSAARDDVNKENNLITNQVKPVEDIDSEPEEDESKMNVWSLAFRRLMADPKGRKVFQQFLQKSLAEENLLFWSACEGIRQAKTQPALELLMQEVYGTFIGSDAPLEVNINSSMVAEIDQAMQQPHKHPNLFRPAQKHIYKLMEKDCFSRFRKQPAYREYMEANGYEMPDTTK